MSITMEKKSTSPGPHGMKKTVDKVRFHKLEKFEKFKFTGAGERRGEPASKAGGMSARKLTRELTKDEKAAERKGEPARKAGGMSARKLTRELTKDEKAAELTRKMERGYRKGYRVPKRPKRGNEGRKANRSSRKSGR